MGYCYLEKRQEELKDEFNSNRSGYITKYGDSCYGLKNCGLVFGSLACRLKDCGWSKEE